MCHGAGCRWATGATRHRLWRVRFPIPASAWPAAASGASRPPHGCAPAVRGLPWRRTVWECGTTATSVRRVACQTNGPCPAGSPCVPADFVPLAAPPPFRRSGPVPRRPPPCRTLSARGAASWRVAAGSVLRHRAAGRAGCGDRASATGFPWVALRVSVVPLSSAPPPLAVPFRVAGKCRPHGAYRGRRFGCPSVSRRVPAARPFPV